MTTREIRLTARHAHTLPQYEHVEVSLTFALDDGESVETTGAKMSTDLADAIRTAIQGLRDGGLGKNTANTVIRSTQATPLKSAVESIVGKVKVLEKSPEPESPKKATETASDGPSPEQIKKRVAAARTFLAKHELSERDFLEVLKVGSIEDVDVIKRKLLSAKDLEDLIIKVRADDEVPF